METSDRTDLYDKVLSDILNKHEMKELTPNQKEKLDEDTQKLLKAGLMSDKLNYTDKAHNKLVSKLMRENLDYLIEQAEEIINEAEDNQ